MFPDAEGQHLPVHHQCSQKPTSVPGGLLSGSIHPAK